jgi:hypothetical protein
MKKIGEQTSLKYREPTSGGFFVNYLHMGL